jgi:hypothetical protein
MKCVPVVAIACVAVLGACSVKEERVVQQPAPAATVVTPAPASNAVVYTTPAPASTTTVYTR